MSIIDLLLIIGAYLLGSVSTAIIVCRLLGLPDPRTQGSRNPGATNVLRIGDKRAAAITLLGDMLKGLVPVLLARALDTGPEALAGVALAAFLGHLYPVFFGFKGGKGVATAFGVLLGLHWMVALAVAATWLVMAKLFRVSSASALTAAALAPLYMRLLTPEPAFFAMSLAMSAMLIWRHRSNIRNLMHGTETKIGHRD